MGFFIKNKKNPSSLLLIHALCAALKERGPTLSAPKPLRAHESQTFYYRDVSIRLTLQKES